MKKLVTTFMAALVAVLFFAGVTPAKADGSAYLGILSCDKSGEGMTYVLFSKFPVTCTYSGVGGEQSYTGISGILLGLDLEWEKLGTMLYGVVGGSSVNPGGLAGKYVGVKASLTPGIGLSAQGGLAGAGNGFELVPLGLGGQVGVGATGGLAYLSIDFAGMKAAPMASATKFVVYFAFDKSVITADGKKVVDAAADYYKKNGTLKIKVDGYTDLAGTAQYNMGLSKRRADAVRAALVADGVPAGVITEAWHGKQNPAVPTPDGVREPRNRRVEILVGP